MGGKRRQGGQKGPKLGAKCNRDALPGDDIERRVTWIGLMKLISSR